MKRLAATARAAITAASVLILVGLVLPQSVVAHPLGNFTINRYNGLTISPEWTSLDRVVDMAELPTVRARQDIDVNDDGATSDQEAAAWAESQCSASSAELALKVAGNPVQFMPRTVGVSFPAGQAGLPTLRLVCGLVATHAALTPGAAVEFTDNSFADRQGWQELVIAPAGLTLVDADAFVAGRSDRLTSYPAESTDVLTEPYALIAVSAIASPVTQATVMPADSVPLGSVSSEVVGDSGAAPMSRPSGADDLPSQITSVLQAQDLNAPAVILALLVAALVGAFHAATPGHGKTLMAAYLVGSRGSTRHAIGLGLTVTVTHTLGVLVLGAIVLAAGAAVPTERLLPALGLVSGVTVTLLGSAFLLQRLREARRNTRPGGTPAPHDEHAPHEASHAPDEGAGWHSHGGVRHTHLPSTDGPLRRRNLVALGLVGGLVPSASAILILVGSIAAGRPAFGMVLITAFGLGMATVLVGLGVLLVRARSIVESLPSRNLERVFAIAPLVTAVVFLVVGVAITLQSGSQLQ